MAAIVKEKFELSDTLVQLYQEMAISPVMLLTNYSLPTFTPKFRNIRQKTRILKKNMGKRFRNSKARSM